MKALAPDERMPTDDRREALRARMIAETPRWYSPWLHLCCPSVVGIGVLALAILSLRDLRPVELLVVPLTWILGNAVEWRVHRDLLHKRKWYAPVLYDQHTPLHHMLYVTRDMAIRSLQEFRLVLIPAYGVFLIFLGTVPIGALLWWKGWHNIAALFMATATFYSTSYEWLHLSYHLGPETWIGRRKLIAVLRRHHAIHHDPRIMQRWNFNVVVPFWDWVRGTIYKGEVTDPAPVAQPAPSRSQ